MKKVKARFGLALLPLLLTACAGLPGTAVRPAAPPHRYGSADILREADRLASQVKDGTLSRTQAADQLNRFRLAHIGHNSIDDTNFAWYRAMAVARDRNQISQEESMTRICTRQMQWHRRWAQMDNRPSNPAFTNFLMEVCDLPPLK
jgi:hypothetical protein